MAEIQEVRHFQVNGKYRVVIERIGSAKGVIGLKCEVNSDSMEEAVGDVKSLFTLMTEFTKANTPSLTDITETK